VINPARGVKRRQVKKPLQNAIPSFSILLAATAHAIIQIRAATPSMSHPAMDAKCTCVNINNPPRIAAIARFAFAACVEKIVAATGRERKVREARRNL
jgi:hypothetical protein